MSLRTRKATKEDFDRIFEISSGHPYPAPDFNNCLGLSVIEDEDNNIVAFGYMKLFVETVFMPDLKGSKKNLVKSLRILQKDAESIAKAQGITQLHCVIDNPSYLEILKRKFGYRPANGQLLSLDVNK